MATSKRATVNQKKKKAPVQRKQSSGSARGIVGVILVCLGILMLVCLCLPSDASFIVLLRHFVQGIAGSICLVVPILVLWCGILLVFSAKTHVKPRMLICCSGILLIILTLLQVLRVDDILLKIDHTAGMERNFSTFINLSFQDSSLMRRGGGILGALFAWPLWRMLDVWGTILVLIFALVLDIMLLTNTTFYKVSEYFEGYFERTREDFHTWRAEQQEARALRREEKANAAAYEEDAYEPEPEEIPRPRGKRASSARGRNIQDVPAAPFEQPSVEDLDVQAAAPSVAARRTGRRRTAQRIPPNDGFEAETASPRRLYTETEELPVQEEASTSFEDGSFETASNASYAAYDEEAEAAPRRLHVVPDDYTDAQEEMPAMARRGQRAGLYAMHHLDAQESAWDGPHIYSESYEEVAGGDEVSDVSSSSGWQENMEEGVSSRVLMPEENETTFPEEVEDQEFTQEEPVQAEAIEEDAVPFVQRVHRRRVTPPVITSDTAEEMPDEPRRRLDDTPLVLPKKQENPLDRKPVEEYRFPPMDLLDVSKKKANINTRAMDEENAQKLVNTLSSFGIQSKVLNVTHGPAITRYELQPAPGVKVSRIVNLVDDIALNMASAGVRIEAPIPGKPAVGIEIPNETISMVSLRDVLDSEDVSRNTSPLACALGKDIAGKNVVVDLAKMPHVLIAGATGSGKSVCINTLINSIIYRATPEEVRLILIDPKVVELSIYNGIPHLLIPVVTDPKKASGALSWAVMEMDHRYKRFAGAGVRDIRGYNANLQDGEEPMPKIVVIIDELADLMMVAPGEVEESICRLAQLARAAGIHLVIATQRPSVNVITGVIKANIPSRIAFAVSSQIDSRTILDGAGAEKLLGKGDMLYAPQGSNKPLRVQGCFVSDDEVSRVVEYVKQRHDVEYDEDVIEHLNAAQEDVPASDVPNAGTETVDELLQQAIEIAVESGQASISMLQRRLRIGYARAGRLIDEMAKRGIVAQAEGAKPRTVLITREEYRQMFEME